MKIAGILAKVTTGNITLPAFQRGYVWKRRQVRELFDSLYRRHPVGSLLTWITSLERGGPTELLLDYWFLQAGMRGRFSASTEPAIKQDLASVNGTMDGIEPLIGNMGTKWGRRQAEPSDFDSWSIGARLYPTLYWPARAGGARDFLSGIDPRAIMPDGDARLEVSNHLTPGSMR